MIQQAEPARLTEKQEQTIVNFLSTNPDFFDRHPELLQQLEISHQKGESVSLIERQVKILRKEIERYQKQIKELASVSHDNEQLNKRLHKLTLTLITTIDFDETLNVIQDKLHEDFDADAVELHLFSVAESEGTTNPDLDGFRELMDSGIPTCGSLKKKQLKELFGPQAEDINSTALIPIRSEGVLGVLAIGSQDKNRFHPDMGTEYLGRLGEIISKALEVVLEPGF